MHTDKLIQTASQELAQKECSESQGSNHTIGQLLFLPIHLPESRIKFNESYLLP